MLDNLLKLVQESAGDAIINNPAIPNEKNNAAIEFATNSIFKGLKGTVQKGGVESIKGLFQNESNVASNSVVQNLSSNVTGDMMKKFGLDKGAASAIVSMLIPIVISKLVKKTNDPGDSSFNLDGILGSLLGNQGKAGGLLNSLKGLLRK